MHWCRSRRGGRCGVQWLPDDDVIELVCSTQKLVEVGSRQLLWSLRCRPDQTRGEAERDTTLPPSLPLPSHHFATPNLCHDTTSRAGGSPEVEQCVVNVQHEALLPRARRIHHLDLHAFDPTLQLLLLNQQRQHRSLKHSFSSQ
jgi:hypothetical protein